MIDLELQRDLRKYSTALLDLAYSKNLTDEVNSGMYKLNRVFKSIYASKQDVENYREFGRKFPVVSHARQTAILKEILKDLNVNHLLSNFILLLLHSKKIKILRALASNWEQLSLSYKGYFKVILTTAIPLDEQQEYSIKKTISEKYGNEFFIEKIVNKAILGGLIISVKDQIIDDSLLSKMKKIENTIKGVI